MSAPRISKSLTVVALLGAALVAVPTAGGQPAAKTIRLYEHDTSQSLIDLGDKGDSPGDLLVFGGDTFTHKGGATVGRVGGSCTTTSIDPGGEQLCSVTFTLPGGEISFQGLVRTDRLFGGRTVSVPVTGGTGAYRHARGSGSVQVSDQTNANYVIHLA